MNSMHGTTGAPRSATYGRRGSTSAQGSTPTAGPDAFDLSARSLSLVSAYQRRERGAVGHAPVHPTALTACAALLPGIMETLASGPLFDAVLATQARIESLTASDCELLASALALDTALFRPLPGKQSLAWEALHGSAHQIALTGGSGSGKSLPALMFAATGSHSARLWRMTAGEHVGLQSELARYAPLDGLNKSSGRWELPAPWGHQGQGTVLQFAQLGDALQSAARGQGVAYDTGIFDDAAGLGTGGAGWLDPETIAVLSKWNRTTVPGVRTRLVFSCNPPLAAGVAGWIKDWWAPWLDGSHPRPATDGELRWFDAENRETEPHAPGAVSRTCVRSTVHDNVFLLRDPQYLRNLEASDPVLKAKLLHGSWDVESPDDPFALFPSAWVDAAFKRYRPPAHAASAYGLDVARGGRDISVLAAMHGTMLGPLNRWPGRSTPDGPTLARLVLNVAGAGRAQIRVDSIGVGGAAVDALRARIFERCVAVNVSERCTFLDSTGTWGFASLRAYLGWNLRTLLDPTNPNAIGIAPDKNLRAELLAFRYSIANGRINVGSKDDIARLLSGRSPDAASAVMLACIPTDSALTQDQGSHLLRRMLMHSQRHELSQQQEQ